MTVAPFPGATRLDLPPERVLQEAQEAGLTGVVILGWGAEALWLMERLKLALLRTVEE